MNHNFKAYPIQEILLLTDSLHGFISSYYKYKKEKNSRLSLRNWSTKLGYSNPSYLSDVINRKRKVTLVLLEKIFSNDNFSENEKLFLRNQFFIEKNSSHHSEFKTLNLLLKGHWENTKETTTYKEDLSPISLIILTYLSSSKSIFTVETLTDRLSNTIPADSIHINLQKLKSLNLIKINQVSQIELCSNLQNKKLVLKPESYLEILPCLQKIFLMPDQSSNHNYTLTFNIPQEFSKDANSIVYGAIEKLMLLEKRHQNTKTNSYQLFTSMFPLENLASKSD